MDSAHYSSMGKTKVEEIGVARYLYGSWSGWIRIFLACREYVTHIPLASKFPAACLPLFFLAPCSPFLENDGHNWLYCYMENWDRDPKLKCFMF
jgi:hypothetical protein